jgi:predicted permease
MPKVEFEKNITVMKTISIFLVTAAKIYLDYESETGIELPLKIFLIYTINPVLYIFIYPVFKKVKWLKKKRDDYFYFLNELTIINFVLIGIFISILITIEIWHSLGFLIYLIYVVLGLMLICSVTVFLSLVISWVYILVKNRI